MKMTFRLECPRCQWGQTFRDSYINMGWLELECSHCGKTYFTKIAVTGVSVVTSIDKPPCCMKVDHEHKRNRGSMPETNGSEKKDEET